MGLFNFWEKQKRNQPSTDNTPAPKEEVRNDKPSIKPRLKRTPIVMDWEKEYINKLKKCYGLAGKQLENYFKENGLEVNWIQNKLMPPPYFQHICFAYGKNIYSVIIEIEDDTCSYVLDRDIKNQLSECEKNDLIPCTMVVQDGTSLALVGGNHLIYTDRRTPVEFVVRQGEVPMSAWEINNFGISIVLDDLKKEGRKILNYCDLLNAEPQIWFEDEHGKMCYAIVKTVSGSSRENLRYQVNHNLVMKLIEYDGFFAQVGLVSADPVAYSKDGNVVPLSERFDMEKTKEVLYREHGFYVKYHGLEYIEKQAAKKGIREESIYPLGASAISSSMTNRNKPSSTAMHVDWDKLNMKHIYTVFMTDYDSCLWVVQNKKGEDRFIFKEGKMIMNDDEYFAPGVLTWIMLNRKNTHDFLIILEILKKDYTFNNWAESMMMPSESLVEEIKKSFPRFSLLNDLNDVRSQLEWAYIDINNLIRFIDEATRFFMEHDSEPSGCTATTISECTTVFDLYCLVFRMYAKLKNIKK